MFLYATMKDKKERDFKGVWIPKEIYLAKDLSWSEKILLIEIDSLDNDEERGCFASNQYLADFLGIKAMSVSNMIANLKEKGYIRQIFFDGRNRGLTTTLKEFQLSKEPPQKSGSRLHKKVNQTPQKSESEPPQKSGHNNIDLRKNNTDRENNAETAPPLETETEAENPNTEQPSPYPLLNSDEGTPLPPPPRRMSSDEAAAALDAEQRFTDLPESEAEKIWRSIFGTISLKGDQIKTLSEIENLNGQAFLETCRLWKQDGYRPQSVGSLIDKYRNVLKFSAAPKTQMGILQHSTKPTSKFFH